MIADYTRIFRDADELADFLMLTEDEQNRFLADIAATKEIGLAAACRITGGIEISETLD